MELSDFTAAVEAQFLMGHVPASGHLAQDRRTILGYSWDVDQVRQALHVPLTPLWSEHILTLEMQGLASFSFNVAPITRDAEGVEHEIDGWQDDPREDWGTVGIHPRGVLRLAELYQRPYVRVSESPVLVAHWTLVQAESDARLREPIDAARFAREWPERWLRWQDFLRRCQAREEDATEEL